ncbi:hypothetical protein E2C06_13040 [Dankookia rubra]|uniref:Lipoprotein n=1 Tax=Dankookia rubra TaxID=1442381 RepID=A0A4R5QFQ1_9PROT|nr:hypothetical protein E2C06_13040 [Dankookia rubra]
MRRLTTLFLAAAAVSLAACAGAPGGMSRATAPAHATGGGLGGVPQATSAAPAAPSGHDHTQADRPHVH